MKQWSQMNYSLKATLLLLLVFVIRTVTIEADSFIINFAIILLFIIVLIRKLAMFCEDIAITGNMEKIKTLKSKASLKRFLDSIHPAMAKLLETVSTTVEDADIGKLRLLSEVGIVCLAYYNDNMFICGVILASVWANKYYLDSKKDFLKEIERISK